MTFIKINQAEYYYELHGTGTIPIILISGYTCDHQFYYPILDSLKDDYKILVLDNLGVGQTVDTYPTLTAELMADDIMVIAEQLKLQKPHIVGQSMGGTIAQSIAARYSEKIASLTLLTPSAKWRSAMLEALAVLLDMRKANLDFELQFKALLPWIFGEAFLNNPEQVSFFKQLLLTTEHPQSLENQIRQYNVLKTFDGRKSLSNIKVETLIVYGNEDLIALPQEARYLHEHIQHSTLIELNCAHAITAEVPEELGKVLLKFTK